MEHKRIAEMYWVLILLKQEYNRLTTKYETFEEFAKRRTQTLFWQAFEWLVEDERESNEKNSQD